MPQSTQNKANKVMLIILDGVGVAPDSRGNAVSQAKTPNLAKYWDAYPHTYLQTDGEAVGLPDGVYGNSEVGHLNIGAGKVVLQNLPRINKSIDTGRIYTNDTLTRAMEHAQNNNGVFHLMGCFSDGAVHAHIDHFIAVLKFLKKKDFQGKVYIHAFTDGRDTSPKEAEIFFTKADQIIKEFQIGHIATIVGRAFAMDRNNKWKRTQKAYDLLTKGKGISVKNWQEGIKQAYEAGQTDEYIEPIVIPDANRIPIIQNNDAVIFMNYRSDRAIQITDAFQNPSFDSFTPMPISNLFYASMVPYRRNYPANQLFPKEYLKLSIGRVLAENEKRQLRIAESEKFPHVTYFFNGGLPLKYNNEDRIEIPSPNVATYDLKPEMSAYELTDALLERIKLNIYDFILVNFANPDMVGHTGNLSACVKAMETIDEVVGRVIAEFTARGGIVALTADHGNVEEIIKIDTGEIDTEHSYNPVPFSLIGENVKDLKLQYGKLADIAPTLLKLMNIQIPNEMQGDSLISSFK